LGRPFSGGRAMNNDLGRVLRVNSSLSDGYDTDRTNGSGCDPTNPRKGDGRFERKRGAVARFAAALALTTCMSLPLTAAWAETERLKTSMRPPRPKDTAGNN